MNLGARQRLARVADAAETAFLVLLVSLLLSIGLLQLVLRNVFHTGVLWFEPLSRYLVLWIAFAGATAAAKEDRHIRVDLLPRILKGRIGSLLGALTSLAASSVCGVLARSGITFLLSEREFGTLAFLSVPTWIALAAIPLGFSLLALRMALTAYGKLARAMQP